MASFREHSKQNWNSASSVEHINAGSLQRIADATEVMSKNYVQLQNERDSYKRIADSRYEAIERLQRSNSALRGQITKLKKKVKSNE